MNVHSCCVESAVVSTTVPDAATRVTPGPLAIRPAVTTLVVRCRGAEVRRCGDAGRSPPARALRWLTAAQLTDDASSPIRILARARKIRSQGACPLQSRSRSRQSSRRGATCSKRSMKATQRKQNGTAVTAYTTCDHLCDSVSPATVIGTHTAVRVKTKKPPTTGSYRGTVSNSARIAAKNVSAIF